MSAPAIEAVDLVKTFGDFTAVDGVKLLGAHGHRLLDARPQRRGQDHDRAHDDDPARFPTSGTAHVAGFDVATEPGRRAPPHGSHRPVRDGRRAAHRAREPPAHRSTCYGLDRAAREALRRRAARAVLDLTEAGDKVVKDLLRRHAAPARPRGQPRRQPAGALPRRADHRARPAQPQRAVGRPARPRARRAPRSCSPPSTSRRPTSSPTGSSSSTTGGSSPRARPLELKDQSGKARRRRHGRAQRPRSMRPPRAAVAYVGEVHVDHDRAVISAPAEGMPPHPHRGAPRRKPPSTLDRPRPRRGRASTTSSSA